MKPESRYVRSDKGAAEVAQRSLSISARARALLLLIDGKSTGAELLEKFAAFPNSAELLQVLEDGGYIAGLEVEPAVAVDAVAEASGENSGQDRTDDEAAGEFDPAEMPADGIDQASLAAAKRQFVRSLNKVLGPDAELLIERVEQASSIRELRFQADKFRAILVEVRGQRSGDSFWRHFEDSLPPSGENAKNRPGA